MSFFTPRKREVAQKAAPRLKIAVLVEGRAVTEKELGPGVWSVGSSDHANVTLPHSDVRPVHAVLVFEGGVATLQVVVDDLSTQVRINGRAVQQSPVLTGDVVECAHFRLVFELTGADGLPLPAAHGAPHAVAGTPELPASAPAQVAAPPPPPAEHATPILLRAEPAVEQALLSSITACEPAVPRLSTSPAAEVIATSNESPAPFVDEAVGEIEEVELELSAEPMPELDSAPVDAAPAITAPPDEPAIKPTVATVEKPEPPAPVRIRTRDGNLRLFVELSWGETLLYRKSFANDSQIVASADDGAQVPLWGFSLPTPEHIIAASTRGGFQVFVPPKARAELRTVDGGLVSRTSSAGDGPLRLERGMSLLMTEGNMALRVRVAPAERMPFVLPGRDMPWLAIAAVALLSTAFGYFAADLPDTSERPVKEPTTAQMVAVRMKMPPPPKKKPEPVKKERKREKEPKVVARKRTNAPAPRNEALESISKLAVNLPTSKLLDSTATLARPAKNPMAALSDAPVLANAAPALGGVRGRSTAGAELLRGRVGSLAVHAIGRSGAVAGTVRRASPRSLGVKGSIDRDAVAKVVNAKLKEVQGCYERALVKSPGLAGKVVLEWTITTDGSVSSARSKSSTLRSLEVEQCIVRELKGWRFPAARGGPVVITYPFLFNAVGF